MTLSTIPMTTRPSVDPSCHDTDALSSRYPGAAAPITSLTLLSRGASSPNIFERLMHAYMKAFPTENAKIRAFLADSSHGSTLPIVIQQQIIRKNIPDHFIVQYAVDSMPLDQVEAALRSLEIDMDQEYLNLSQMEANCVAPNVTLPAGKTAKTYFNAQHGDTEIKRFISVFKHYETLPSVIMAHTSYHQSPRFNDLRKTYHEMKAWASGSEYFDIQFVNTSYLAFCNKLSQENPATCEYIEFLGTLLILPPQLFTFTALKCLNITMSRLRKLPPEIKYLTALETLNLDYNKLNELPKELAEVQTLTTLDLSYNPIGNIATILPLLRSLEYVVARQGSVSAPSSQIRLLEAVLPANCTLDTEEPIFFS